MSAINNYYSKLSQNYYQMPKVQTIPAFRANFAVSNQQTQPDLSNATDTVEISGKNKNQKPKEKISSLKKAGITALGVIGGLAAVAVCFAKHQTNRLTKLYNEKMQLVNLAEKIDFKEAKTVEEGIKFAKDVLKIGEVDSNFTLDAINYANRGLVDVSNANKGKLFIPKKMLYKDLKEDTLAHVIKNVESENFGEFAINKKFFDDKKINEIINKSLFYEDKTQIFKFNSDGKIKTYLYNGIPIIPSEDVQKLIQKYYKNPNELNINDKRLLCWSLNNGFDKLYAKFERYPLDTIKKHQQYFEKELNININIADLTKKTTKEQEEILENWTNEIFNKKNSSKIAVKMDLYSPTETIYHEMGHLQDFAKNLKELDLKHWKFSLSEIWKEADKNVKEGHPFKRNNSAEIEHVDNRWGGLTYKGYKELFEKDPAKFKKRYPDLYEFLTNQEYQQTAGKVSDYAQTSIGEFIADTYAKMVRGDKITDDVMKLYEKYNGPKLGD